MPRLVVACVSLLSSFAVLGSASSNKMNVLLLVADDLKPDIYLPEVHTPNFDALSTRSLVLGANFVQVPVCGPTRTCVSSAGLF